MSDVTLNGVTYILDGAGDGLRGTHTRQDITPTFVQATEGSAGDTDVQPFAEIVYSSFNGSIGLYERTSAPGDLTRAWISDADTTRPNQLTPWLRFATSGATVAVDDSGSGARKCVGIIALVNPSGQGWGFIGFDNTAVTYWYYRWDGTKFARVQQACRSADAIGIAGTQSVERIPTTASGMYYSSVSIPSPYIVQATSAGAAQNLWCPLTNNSMVDINTGAAPVAGVGAGNAGVFVYFDILFTVSYATSSITITPYRPNTPAAGNVVQAITSAGSVSAAGNIRGETTFLGATPCEGAVYMTTERSVYALSWNDKDNSMLITKLFELPRITGAPITWNGEVYIPTPGRLAHITPGQRGYDWKNIDSLATLPPSINTNVLQLIPFPDRLVAHVSDWQSAKSAILSMNTEGAWACHAVFNAVARSPLIPIVDGTTSHHPAVAIMNSSTLATMDVYPIPDNTRNPRYMSASLRANGSVNTTDNGANGRTITPWEYGANRSSQKQLMRFRLEVANLGSVRAGVYYQIDDDDRGSDSFTQGCAKGTGTWRQAAQVTANTAGSTGTITAAGNGTVWFEFDGTTVTSWSNPADSTGHSASVTLPAYPSFRRIRWLFDSGGDTTGTVFPTIVATAWQRLEYPWKFYLYSIRLRIALNDSLSGSPSPYTSYALVKSAVTALETLASAKTVFTYVDVEGNSKKVVITKIVVNAIAKDNGGLREAAVDLSLQEVAAVGMQV